MCPQVLPCISYGRLKLNEMLYCANVVILISFFQFLKKDHRWRFMTECWLNPPYKLTQGVVKTSQKPLSETLIKSCGIKPRSFYIYQYYDYYDYNQIQK